ncbi:DUF6331 family protein [Plantactinospora sp. CA-290183]|uniref:DUF6331 family protein n=1 Tax=Plantactinospora sp. CA-290183 TaxID=3240006 RepID=UPI003D8FBC0D
MADVSVEIPSPLSEGIIFGEVECVRACCGTDAVSTDPALIGAWCRQVGSVAVVEARLQLAELIEVVEDRSHRVTSTFLGTRGRWQWRSSPPSRRSWRYSSMVTRRCGRTGRVRDRTSRFSRLAVPTEQSGVRWLASGVADSV